jgi:hypothetical protein
MRTHNALKKSAEPARNAELARLFPRRDLYLPPADPTLFSSLFFCHTLMPMCLWRMGHRKVPSHSGLLEDETQRVLFASYEMMK